MPKLSASLALSAGLALTGLAGAAHAALPKPVDFDLTYFITDESGERARQMGEADHLRFANRARCGCGQQIELELGARLGADDNDKRFDARIGTTCDVAENWLAGPHARCGALPAALGPTYNRGIEASFHPAFLGHGVAPGTLNRHVDGPDTVLVGACEGQGTAGLWICAPQESTLSGCQQEEFFLSPESTLSALSGIEPLRYDFEPPVARPSDLSALPGNGAVELNWSLPSSGDIAGLRVLCEEADTGLAPGLGLPTPEVTAVPDDAHYFTAHNLCGDQPFSTVQVAAPPPSPALGTCGDGLQDPGEACDDGEDNGPEGLCDPACQLRVSPELHRLDWTHLCSEHLTFTEDSVVIGGLDNGTTYNFVLVAHDTAGNPRALAHVVTATPDASLPDLLPAAEDGCACTASSPGPVFSGMFMIFIIALAQVRPRRRA